MKIWLAEFESRNGNEVYKEVYQDEIDARKRLSATMQEYSENDVVLDLLDESNFSEALGLFIEDCYAGDDHVIGFHELEVK